jgi:ribosomal protein L11 methyltransferase
MSNIYIGYHFKVEPKEVGSEILIAELGETVESFTETETEFLLLYKRNYGTEQ